MSLEFKWSCLAVEGQHCPSVLNVSFSYCPAYLIGDLCINSMTMPQECEDGLGTFCEHLSKIMCWEQQECRVFLFFVSESGPLTVQYPLTTSREHYSNNREEKLAVSAASYRQTWPAVLVGTHPGHRSTDLGPVSARMWPVFPLLPEMCVFLWDNHSSPVNNLKHLHCSFFILFFFTRKDELMMTHQK